MNETTDETLVEISGLRKSFGRFRALDGIDLKVRHGLIVGLLGANGSGKSTLLRHIIGHCLPDAGYCRTLGCPAADLGADELSRIGYVHQRGELMGWLRVRSLIDYVGAYYRNWDRTLVRRMVDEVQIPMDSRVETLSPGQRQKLSILLAICFHPELLILDEPAADLDPIARARFMDLLLEQIQNHQRTIIISSHILSDIEKIVDHVVILDRGMVLRDCSLDDLREEFVRVRINSTSEDLPERFPISEAWEERRSQRQAALIVRHPDRAALESFANDSGFELEITALSLDECYRQVVETANERRAG